ncbi:TcmI family type II polyketide cyclase [Microlunatus ginsengisoli]|uniref:Polyketide synthesis cyclase n=1 Tax=Microlunatus ginsengisoli TaxID=363863 RepID=A0ABP7AH49_9ACTN
MFTTVTVGRFDEADAAQVSKILQGFDETSAPTLPQLRRRQFFSYCGLWVHVQDFAATPTPAVVAALAPLTVELSAYLRPYVAEDPAATEPLDDQLATRFYLWPGDQLPDVESVHSGVIVNAVAPEDEPEVARIFAEFDATGYQHKMGTLRRQVLSYRGIYLHLQDFANPDSKEVIGDTWKQSDPIFLQIVADLTPIVPPYDPAGGQLATRTYHWAATS